MVAVSDWSQLSAARAAVRRASALVAPDLADTAELVASELVTNALLHGGGRAELRVRGVEGGLRVGVRDAEPRAPLVAVASEASMTGRGLRLVAALSKEWGVAPLEVGKEVWAVVSSGGAAALDPEELLHLFDDAWDDAAAATAVGDHHRRYVTVSLGEVPTDLLLRAKTHVDNLVREFRLASAPTPGTVTEISTHLAELIDTVVHRFVDARDGIKRQAIAAHDAGKRRTHLELRLPLDAADAGEQYLAALDEVDAYCRAMRLLTLETPPEQRVFRRWYVEELVRQVRARARGEEPQPGPTFEERLLQEVAEAAATQQASDRAARLSDVAVALSGAASAEDVSAVVLRQGVAALGATGAGVLLVNDDGTLAVTGTVGYDDVVVEQLRREEPDADLPAAHAMRTGESVWLESPEERDQRFPALLGMERSTISMCAVPLVIADHPVGALRFSFETARLFDPEERRFVEALAAQCAQAIERTRLERKAQEDRFRVAVDTMLDPAMMCRPVRDEAGVTVDLRVEYVNAAADDAGTGAPLGRLLSELWPTIREQGLLRRYLEVAETGHPLSLDSFVHADATDSAAESVFDIRATRIGELVFVVYRNVTDRTERERELRRHQEALAEAQRIANVGSWQWNVVTGVARWSDQFFEICGLSAETITASRDQFLALLTAGGREALSRAITESARTGRRFQLEQRIIRPDGDPRDLVVTGEATADASGAVTFTRGTIQDVTDRRFVELALRRSEERLRREHENVEILQAAILPSVLPEIPGATVVARYLAASENGGVGGDFYDAFILADGRVLLTVGDVAGKGIDAAEAVGQLRNSLRMAAVIDPDPGRLVERLNELIDRGFPAPFATAVIGLYTPQDGAFTWANAGHLPIVVRDPRGDVEVIEGATHPPLGVDRVRLRPTPALTLEPGSVLLLFSDGLVERRGEDLDTGLARLADSLRVAPEDVAAIPDTLLEANLRDEPRRDDVCLLLVRRAR